MKRNNFHQNWHLLDSIVNNVFAFQELGLGQIEGQTYSLYIYVVKKISTYFNENNKKVY